METIFYIISVGAKIIPVNLKTDCAKKNRKDFPLIVDAISIGNHTVSSSIWN